MKYSCVLKFARTTFGVRAGSAALLAAAGLWVVARAQPPGFGRLIIITTFVGNGQPVSSGDGGPALAAGLAAPRGMAFDAAGNLYVAEQAGHRVRKIDRAGIITTVAGTGEPGASGDGGSAVRARLRSPRDVALDAAGVLYIADTENGRVRAVNPAGLISTVAGGGSSTADGVPATQAWLGEPSGIEARSAQVLYIADSASHRIRRLDPDGTLTTAGNADVVATLRRPAGIQLDMWKRLLIADLGAHRVWQIGTDGSITGVAGTGVFGKEGDNGPALDVQLAEPVAIAVDRDNNFFLAEAGAHRVRRVNTSGSITTLAGVAEPGFSGDGGAAPSARLNAPGGLAISPAGDVYVADTGNHRIRKLWVADNTPSIGKNGVVNAAGFQPQISPGAWVSIFGNHLSLETRTWDAEFVNSAALPTVLGGVRVRINQNDGYVAYVSPTQINVLVPPDQVTGSVSVMVIAPQAAATSTATLDRYSPGLFTCSLKDKRHAVAQFANENVLVAPEGAIPGAVSRPARPGDRLQLYATGLGPTNPPYPVGRILDTAYPLEGLSRLSVSLGPLRADVLYAAMIMPGLYQVNIQVPQGAAGELPISISIEGRASQPEVVLTFQK